MNRLPRQDDLRADQARDHVLRTRGARPGWLARWTAARWRNADPRNAAAYADAAAAWAALEAIDLGPVEARRPPRRRRGALVAAGLVATAMLLGLDQLPAGGLSALGADFRTAPGQLRTVRLQDGSEITLDGATAVDVSYTQGERRLSLIAGQARFEVRPDEARPFIVTAGEAAVRATGTVFQMSRHDGRVAVAVSEGRVLAGRDVPDAISLTAGQACFWIDGERSNLKAVDPRALDAWSRGRLVVRGASMRTVADALERSSGDRIIVLGKARAVRVTAVFDARDPDGALRRMDATLPIRVSRPLPGWVVIR